MLEHISPWEFREVRRALGHGSGFDSPGWNRLRHLAPELRRAYARLLERRGLTVVQSYVQGRQHEDLYQLAEALIELDERCILWRSSHLQMLEREIGNGVIGTQGTPVDILDRLLRKPLFPELWEARTELTELAVLEQPGTLPPSIRQAQEG
jgi:tryptophan 2,3-dioxygenase